MAAFSKRTFESFKQFTNELRFVRGAKGQMRGILAGTTLSAAFRERLFMAVTSVNQCRYCSFVHSRAALKAGVSREELDGFLTKEAQAVPKEERVAVVYAQHWVDSGGNPDPETLARLNEAYPPETAAAIQTAIRFINFNNLAGNTWDKLLHTVSFGLLGGGK